METSNDMDILADAQPPPPLLHEVYVVVSSVPSGAEVLLDGAVIGRTPYADLHTFDLDAGGLTRTFGLRLEGHLDASVELDVSGERVIENVDMQARAPRKRVAPAGPGGKERSASSVRVDDVLLTVAEADAALGFINTADEAALRAAGIAGRQVNIILEKRPFDDLAAFGATPFIGRKTVEAAVGAAR